MRYPNVYSCGEAGGRDDLNERWSTTRAREWHDHAPWLFGCNFTPSYAGNQLEFWSEETFDPVVIARELGWASGLGMNVVRVYLHDLLWKHDGERFIERVRTFLDIAESCGIRSMPVLFDGVWNPVPVWGPQQEPVPRVHNSMWVQSPGAEVMYDESRWPELVSYVEHVLAAFANDGRVVAWDLFNEPDQLDLNTIVAGSRDHKAEVSARLVDEVFRWAREVHVSQPLTVGMWEYDNQVPVPSALNDVILNESDIVSFHCYQSADALTGLISNLAIHDRPLVCTEWLARSEGSTVDLISIFRDERVGAINWGLVDGKTQTRFPWRTWWEQVEEDEPWFHELLHADGRPYDEEEVALLRSVAANEIE